MIILCFFISPNMQTGIIFSEMIHQVFKEQDGLEKAVATEEHNIKNKKVAVKKAQAKQGKVYVGKLPKDDKLSDDAIKEFFAGYGAIAAVEQPFDKVRIINFIDELYLGWANS